MNIAFNDTLFFSQGANMIFRTINNHEDPTHLTRSYLLQTNKGGKHNMWLLLIPFPKDPITFSDGNWGVESPP